MINTRQASERANIHYMNAQGGKEVVLNCYFALRWIRNSWGIIVGVQADFDVLGLRSIKIRGFALYIAYVCIGRAYFRHILLEVF